jgi:hypothetical protein
MRDSDGDWFPVRCEGVRRRFEYGLSVFFPAFNDGQSLEPLLARTMKTLQEIAADFEVVVVNDGSTDDTGEVLERLRVKYAPWLRIVTHERNRGYGAAIRSGLSAATKEFIFYTDGDGQYDPAEMERLLRAVTPETGLVNGYKTERNDPWHRVLIGALYNRLARWLFRIRLRDIDCDFRLIRRSALDLSALHSTGGPICVELVRSLELSGTEVVELPVRHYPRRYGRSQFFRFQSLFTTFLQLLAVYWRLVIVPWFERLPIPERAEMRQPTRQAVAVVVLLVPLLSLLAYARALPLPFISDSYLQIELGRSYGPVSGWGALAHDALYRCRATSLVLTYWTEQAFGVDPLVFRMSSLALHILCAFLVFAMGIWRPVGWRAAAVAACFFAVSQRHSEAVIWYAAVPELLVFLFALCSFLCWVHWVQSARPRAVSYAGALLFYLLALLSKESAVAVVPLCALAALLQGRGLGKRLLALIPFALCAVGYFGMAFAARDTHQHFNDGTFSLRAPFMEVLVRSTGGLLWVWGFAALGTIVWWKPKHWRLTIGVSFGWMTATLLPYCFLLYMPRVPSRHTYFASAGLSLLVAGAWVALRERSALEERRWLTPAVACVLVLHQAGYLWTSKHRQYSLRAEPTEALIRLAEITRGPIHASCFPYPEDIAENALRVSLPGARRTFQVTGTDSPNGVNFCNAVVHGGSK